MKIREARPRDAAKIAEMLPQEAGMTQAQILEMIQGENKVFIAADFSANILGCALDKERVYVSKNCYEPGVDEELKKQY